MLEKKRPRATASGKSSAAGNKPARRKYADTATVREVFTRLRAQNPEPRGELEYVNPYTLLVAVVLSAQATDAGVNKATRALFAAADTPQKMLALGEDRVREHIKTIGLFRAKAKNVIALSQILVEKHGGQVPRDAASLEALPGVGRKTANVVRNIAFGEPTIAVDTHLFRISNRIPLARCDGMHAEWPAVCHFAAECARLESSDLRSAHDDRDADRPDEDHWTALCAAAAAGRCARGP